MIRVPRLRDISSASAAAIAALAVCCSREPANAMRFVPGHAPAVGSHAAAAYSITNLGALLGGGSITFVPTALNDAGQIVGYDEETLANGNAGAAYLINANGTFGILDNSGNTSAFYIPVAISDDGHSVAGEANQPGDDYGRVPVSGPVVWSLLGTTHSHQNYREFPAKNQPDEPPITGLASGNVPVGGPDYFGFKTYSVTPFKTACAIGNFFAEAIDDAGTIVGSGAGYAASDTTTGCPTAIPGLPRPPNESTSAVAIDADGDLIISVQGPAAPAFGAYYLFGKAGLKEVTLPANYSAATYFLRAVALNDAGTVVGNVALQVPPFNPVAALLYQNGRSVDANTLLPVKSGWQLLTAVGVNASGEIVGTGYYNGRLQGYALHP